MNDEVTQMKGISIALFVLGGFGLFLSTIMFGDIGVAAGIGALTALLSGAGFWMANNRLPKQ